MRIARAHKAQPYRTDTARVPHDDDDDDDGGDGWTTSRRGRVVHAAAPSVSPLTDSSDGRTSDVQPTSLIAGRSRHELVYTGGLSE